MNLIIVNYHSNLVKNYFKFLIYIILILNITILNVLFNHLFLFNTTHDFILPILNCEYDGRWIRIRRMWLVGWRGVIKVIGRTYLKLNFKFVMVLIFILQIYILFFFFFFYFLFYFLIFKLCLTTFSISCVFFFELRVEMLLRVIGKDLYVSFIFKKYIYIYIEKYKYCKSKLC